MKKLVGHFHVQVSVEFLKEAIAEGTIKPSRAITFRDGKPMSNHEAMLALADMEKKGLKWFPCDNADKTGKCLGHPS